MSDSAYRQHRTRRDVASYTGSVSRSISQLKRRTRWRAPNLNAITIGFGPITSLGSREDRGLQPFELGFYVSECRSDATDRARSRTHDDCFSFRKLTIELNALQQ